MTILPKRAALLPLLLLPVLACERLLPRPAQTVPTAVQADSIFQSHGIHGAVAVRGNVVELSVQQQREQLRRGGQLWAMVGPYIYLFSPATPELFEQYPGLAAVRTRTLVGTEEVARVQVVRDTVRAGEWKQAQALLAQALREGTARPSRLEALVRFGERYATYEYNPAFVPVDDE